MNVDFLLCLINYVMLPFVAVSIDLRRKKTEITSFGFGIFLLYISYMIEVICVVHLLGHVLIRIGVITEITGNTTRYTLIAGLVAFILPYLKEIVCVYLNVRCEIRAKGVKDSDVKKDIK